MHWKTASVSAFSVSGAEGRERWGFATSGRRLASLVRLGWAPVGSPRGVQNAGGRVWCWTALASPAAARLSLGVRCRLHPVSVPSLSLSSQLGIRLHLMTLPQMGHLLSIYSVHCSC